MEKKRFDPYGIENCPKHLCGDCSQKCEANNDEPDCDECPYEPDYD